MLAPSVKGECPTLTTLLMRKKKIIEIFNRLRLTVCR